MLLSERYTLADGTAIPKLGLGTWLLGDDKAHQAVVNAMGVARPCPFEPCRRRSGERSASATTKFLPIAWLRIVCRRKLLPLP